MATVLITGISGSLAQLCAERLHEQGHDIVGVDYRQKSQSMAPQIVYYRANYNKRIIGDVFKKHKPTFVLHLGRVGNLKGAPNKRFDLNVIGSAKILEMCLEHNVQRLIVLSTFHIYGAHPHNHIPIYENEPLRAAQTFPQLSDAVQLDNMAANWVYRHRKLKTVVLRPCNIVGPHIRNAISMFLRHNTKTNLIGFNPMWQFIHQIDMVRAILLALFGDEVGIFNVAGACSIPIVEALKLAGGRIIPVAGAFADVVLRLTGTMIIPHYFLDYLRYPCVIGDGAFRKSFGYNHTVGIRQTIASTVGGIVA